MFQGAHIRLSLRKRIVLNPKNLFSIKLNFYSKSFNVYRFRPL
jgi:hypothetical protein